MQAEAPTNLEAELGKAKPPASGILVAVIKEAVNIPWMNCREMDECDLQHDQKHPCLPKGESWAGKAIRGQNTSGLTKKKQLTHMWQGHKLQTCMHKKHECLPPPCA